jgi:hypothetical protein
MKNLIISLLIIIAGILACSQAPKKIPVTTKSETALKLYNEAIEARADVYLSRYMKLSDSAIKEDPDFFMASYQMAMQYLYFNNITRFKKYGEMAVNSKLKLSKGELILKDAVQKLLENPKADVTDLGRKIIELYPEDVSAYFSQFFSQVVIKDTAGLELTLKKALEVTDDPAPVYNVLGYVYMNESKWEDAAAALDKYIELKPNIPNPYDSKGDYFMRIKDYENAYKSYMKAHEIDTLWDKVKIKNVKKILDSLAVK